MNIFDNHLKEIQNLILMNKKKLKLENIDNLRNVNLEIPPEQFNFDLSCNIAMVLGKSNKLNPKDLAKNIKEIFLIIASFDSLIFKKPAPAISTKLK